MLANGLGFLFRSRFWDPPLSNEIYIFHQPRNWDPWMCMHWTTSQVHPSSFFGACHTQTYWTKESNANNEMKGGHRGGSYVSRSKDSCLLMLKLMLLVYMYTYMYTYMYMYMHIHIPIFVVAVTPSHHLLWTFEAVLFSPTLRQRKCLNCALFTVEPKMSLHCKFMICLELMYTAQSRQHPAIGNHCLSKCQLSKWHGLSWGSLPQEAPCHLEGFPFFGVQMIYTWWMST